jgi:hypothetical protein
MPRVLRRLWSNLWRLRRPLIALIGNLSYRSNLRLSCKAYADFALICDNQRGGKTENKVQVGNQKPDFTTAAQSGK